METLLHIQTDTHTYTHYLSILKCITGFPNCSVVKNSPVMQVTQVWPLDQWRSPGEENSNPPQYSCLGNSMDRIAWWATAQRVRYDWMMKYTQTSQYHFIIGATGLREVKPFVFDWTASSWERRAMTPWLWTPCSCIVVAVFFKVLCVCGGVRFKNTYLAVLGLHCHTWDLQSLVWYVGL